MAAIPDAAGTIHGCYSNTGKKTLRVIDSENGGACTAQESALNWAQNGLPQAYASLYTDNNGNLQLINPHNIDSLVVSTQNSAWWCLKLSANVQNPHVLMANPGFSGTGFNSGSLAADLTPLGSITDFGCATGTSAIIGGGPNGSSLPQGTIAIW